MHDNPSARWQRALPLALPLGVYLFAAVVITWPLAARLTTHAAGHGFGDGYEVIRQVWWAREQIADGQNPFHQPLLVYPDGFTSWLQWTQPLQYLPAALLASVVSPLTAFNLTLLIALALNGLGGYALGLTLTRNRSAALLGGLALMAFPAAQGHLSVGHLGNVILFPAALLARSLWRVLFERAGWREVLLGGVWAALTALGHVTQITFVLFPLAAFLLLGALIISPRAIVRRGEPLGDQPLARAVAMLALGGLLLVPFFAPLLTESGRAELSSVEEGGRVTFSADALAFVSPSAFGPLDDAGLTPDYARRVLGTNSAEGSAYLGAIPLVFAAIALVRRRRTACVWAILALGAMLLSLGPLLKWQDEPVTLKVEEYESRIPLPWAFLETLPVFDATRTPGRFNLATGIAVSALVSVGASIALDGVRRSGWRAALVAALGGLILLEFQLFWPFPTDDARQPGYFRDLAHMDNVRAVLNVPADDLLVAKIGLYQQTFHGKPLIAGHTLRRTPQDPAILALLDRAALGGEAADWGTVRAQDVAALLSAAGADRVIVHKAFLDDPAAALDRLRVALGPPEYEDERIAVFAVPREDTLADDALPIVPGFGGWSEPVTATERSLIFLAGEGAWHVYSPTEQFGELAFGAAPYRTARPLSVSLDGQLLAAWTLAEGFGADAIRLPLWLEPGFHTLTFEAPDGCTPYPFELGCWDEPLLGASCAPVELPACISIAFTPPVWEPLPDLPTPSEVRFEVGLRLRGYTLDTTQEAVEVRLFWQTDGPLPADYALFVHLADPATNQPLAQFDGYPAIHTDEWVNGAAWVSEVTIALPDDLPPGEYAINVGWADHESGARLPLDDAPGGLVRLDSITHAGAE